jgi:hypothetical protein
MSKINSVAQFVNMKERPKFSLANLVIGLSRFLFFEPIGTFFGLVSSFRLGEI